MVAVAGAASAADAALGLFKTCVTGEKMWVTGIEMKVEGKGEGCFPPPRPKDEPAPAPLTISVGQTSDQVEEIYYFKDLKVIFVNGKVSDVQ